MTFGERLTKCRTLKGLSIKELSEITGISKTVLRYYEKDITDPSLFKISCIATALGVSIDYLAGLSNVK